MAPHAEGSIQTGTNGRDGHLRIELDQVSQNLKEYTSDVRVMGFLVNDNDFKVTNDSGKVERDISGAGTYHPSDFEYNISGHHDLCFISHTFTIPHNDDGTKTVSFTAHYGNTGTDTFGSNKSVSASLTLTAMDVGAWIRIGIYNPPHIETAQWVHAVPYIRNGGKWKKATAYVRTGGIWKPCQ